MGFQWTKNFVSRKFGVICKKFHIFSHFIRSQKIWKFSSFFAKFCFNLFCEQMLKFREKLMRNFRDIFLAKICFAKFCFVFSLFICLRNRNENYVSFAANPSPVKKQGFCKSNACENLKYFKLFNLIEFLVHQRYSASGCKEKGIIKVELSSIIHLYICFNIFFIDL